MRPYCNPVDVETRLAILRNKVKSMGVEIPEDYKSLETTMLAIDVQPESRFNIFTLNITADD